MHVVIFEVEPRDGRRETYFETAAALKAELVKTAAVNAGADLNNPAHKFMLDKYDGPADAESVAKFFGDMGVTVQSPQSPEQPPAQQAPDAATAQAEQIASQHLNHLGQGLDAMAPGAAGSAQPNLAEQIRQAGAAGKTQEEIMAMIPSELLAEHN